MVSALPVPFSRANASLSHVNITHNQIVGIIQKCSAKKALGCDEISVAMLHLCASEVAYPLRLIFQKCLTNGKFPDSWKYANAVPIHKKGSCQLKMNYRPISKYWKKLYLTKYIPFLMSIIYYLITRVRFQAR